MSYVSALFPGAKYAESADLSRQGYAHTALIYFSESSIEKHFKYISLNDNLSRIYLKKKNKNKTGCIYINFFRMDHLRKKYVT